ncbi:MAG: hypothetical protein COV66_12270 [Nitrospinae bacterium CG11_big_fil_rev_8_21_14_0_20_45_15]|nr:MAG: hypothetical protein COV66_12270 [Nitrospinae bacterium CG11_big_fil_rev_8_21_14_0_20_45_15]
MTPPKSLTLLKVLTVMAWADGLATQAELNFIKNLMLKFNLNVKEWEELKPFMEAPLPSDKQEALFTELRSELSTAQARASALEACRTVVSADGELDANEEKLLQEFSRALEGPVLNRSATGGLGGFVRNILPALFGKPDPDMERYFKREIFHKIELKLSGEDFQVDWQDDRLYLVCLLGVLLAQAAKMDGEFAPDEKNTLRTLVSRKLSLSENEAILFVEVLEEQVDKGFDCDEVISEVNRLVSFNDRLGVMDCFFAVACADGELTHEETEEIRRITKAMLIPHSHFISAKLKALDHIRKI